MGSDKEMIISPPRYLPWPAPTISPSIRVSSANRHCCGCNLLCIERRSPSQHWPPCLTFCPAPGRLPSAPPPAPGPAACPQPRRPARTQVLRTQEVPVLLPLWVWWRRCILVALAQRILCAKTPQKIKTERATSQIAFINFVLKKNLFKHPASKAIGE